MKRHLENKSSELTAFLKISSQIGRREAKHRLATGWRGRAEAGVEGKGRGRWVVSMRERMERGRTLRREGGGLIRREAESECR